MKSKILIIACAAFLITGCKEETNKKDDLLQKQIEQYDSIMDKAIEVHDQVMEKMPVLMELSGELKAKKTEENQAAFDASITELETAHEEMMGWMRDYSSKFPYGDPSPETEEELKKKTPVLTQEVDEIVQLREKTNTAITNAQRLLEMK
jgi:hypothetical protein